MLSRREFTGQLTALGTLAAAGWSSHAHSPASETDLRVFAQRVPVRFAAGDTREIAAWCINGTCPGPLLELTQGARRIIRVTNDLDEATSMHWHGLRSPNKMDGVAGVTQVGIAPRGGMFAYDLSPADAGTFWYHPHLAGLRQQGYGLAGPLVVHSADEPEFFADQVLFAQDWFLNETLDAPSASFHRGLVSDEGMKRGYRYVIQLYGGSQISVAPGRATRLRCINGAGFAGYKFRVVGASAWCIALDGLPLANPEPYPEKGIELFPGQRMDLAIVPTSKAKDAHVLVENEYAPYYGYGQNGITFPFAVANGSHATAQAASFVLPPHDIPVPDLARATMETIVVRKTFRTLWNRLAYDTRAMLTGTEDKKRYFWTFNDRLLSDEVEAEMCLASKSYPLLTLRLGQSYILRIQNSVHEPHPFHLHGHSFQEVARNDTLLPRPVWRDTTFVPTGESVDIAFVADNPGNWMFHCHTTGHQMQGMMGIIRVDA
jgi:FtsP/CotA-like multicopper oxidase with cupredoxin domain